MSAQNLDEPLRRAIQSGDMPAVESGLAAGASLETADARGRTPLLAAVEADQTEIALRLIGAGADLNAQAQNQNSPWLQAGALGRTKILAAMIATGRVDYTKRNRYGGNALIPACERGHVETVRLLLEKSRIDVDHVNNLGWTALLEAIVLSDGGPRHQEIVALLLAHKADPNLADKDGASPLTLAKQRGYSAIATLLEQAGGR